MDWRKHFGKEARVLIFFAPLLAASIVLGSEAARSQAVERLSESPVSPVSPLASATSSPGVIALGSQNSLWIAGVAVLVLVAIAGAVLWRRRGSTSA